MKIRQITTLLYSVEEVSLILRTNKDYVYALIRAGLLPAIKLGRLKVLKSSLEQFVKDYEGKDLSNPSKVVDICFK